MASIYSITTNDLSEIRNKQESFPRGSRGNAVDTESERSPTSKKCGKRRSRRLTARVGVICVIWSVHRGVLLLTMLLGNIVLAQLSAPSPRTMCAFISMPGEVTHDTMSWAPLCRPGSDVYHWSGTGDGGVNGWYGVDRLTGDAGHPESRICSRLECEWVGRLHERRGLTIRTNH